MTTSGGKKHPEGRTEGWEGGDKHLLDDDVLLGEERPHREELLRLLELRLREEREEEGCGGRGGGRPLHRSEEGPQEGEGEGEGEGGAAREELLRLLEPVAQPLGGI